MPGTPCINQHHIVHLSLPQPSHKELLSDVVSAVGVLEGQVELVMFVQHLMTEGGGAWAGFVTTCTVDIHGYILG